MEKNTTLEMNLTKINTISKNPGNMTSPEIMMPEKKSKTIMTKQKMLHGETLGTSKSKDC